MRNPVGQKLRHAALEHALTDMEAWLETGAGPLGGPLLEGAVGTAPP